MTNNLKDKLITIIPFVMLFITALTGYFAYFDSYPVWYKYLPDSVGYSVTTNVWFLLLYTRKSFCIQTKIAVYGLLIMNLISLIYVSGGWTYNKVYDLWISITIIFIATLTMIKWKQ